jgi:hypothetical protein
VEERDGEQHDVVRLDGRRLDLGDLLVVGEQGPVGEHRALRVALGTAGVDQYGQVLPAGRRLDGLSRDVRRSGKPVRNGDPGHIGLADQYRGARVAEDLTQLPRGVPGVDRYGDEPGTQDPEVGDREVGHVGQHDGDPGRVPGRGVPASRRAGQPEIEQRPRGPVDQLVELCPGQDLVLPQEGGLTGTRTGGSPPNQVSDVAWHPHGG